MYGTPAHSTWVKFFYNREHPQTVPVYFFPERMRLSVSSVMPKKEAI